MTLYRTPHAKPGELKSGWGKAGGSQPAINYAWGGGGADGPDARIVCNALEEAPVYGGRSLVEELEQRGYDLTTLKFSIRLKKPNDAT